MAEKRVVFFDRCARERRRLCHVFSGDSGDVHLLNQVCVSS